MAIVLFSGVIIHREIIHVNFLMPYLQDHGFLRTRNLQPWQSEVTIFFFFFNFADTYLLTVALVFKETPWTTMPLHVGIPALFGKTVLDHMTCVLGTAVSSVNWVRLICRTADHGFCGTCGTFGTGKPTEPKKMTIFITTTFG